MPAIEGSSITISADTTAYYWRVPADGVVTRLTVSLTDTDLGGVGTETARYELRKASTLGGSLSDLASEIDVTFTDGSGSGYQEDTTQSTVSAGDWLAVEVTLANSAAVSALVRCGCWYRPLATL